MQLEPPENYGLGNVIIHILVAGSVGRVSGGKLCEAIECLGFVWLEWPAEHDVCVRHGNNLPRGQCVKVAGRKTVRACGPRGSTEREHSGTSR